MTKWYVIKTKPNQELRAKKNLLLQGFKIFYPFFSKNNLSKKNKKEICLFPSYFFVNFDINKSSWLKIDNTFGVKELLKAGKNNPTEISSDFILRLKSFCDKEGLVSQNYFDLKKGQKIMLINGPFFNYFAEFLSLSSSQRVLVLLDVFAKKTKISMSRKDIVVV